MIAAALKSGLFLFWLASVAFYILSAYCLRAFYKKRGRDIPAGAGGSVLPPATVLKPIKGADENTYDNLRSFLEQDYPCFQVVFGMASEDDPARAVVERLMAEYPGRDIALVVSAKAIGPNYKISNLHNMYEKAKYDILVIADSDMRVGGGYLREVAGGFDDASVGLVTCPYRGAYPENVGAALEALTINTDFLPSVVVAERLEGLSFALGATMAVRRDALEGIGGLRALADYLADDYMLGSLVMKAGYRLRLSGHVVDSVEGRQGVYGWFMHQLRWGRTYRACRPGGYFLSGITKGTAISFLFLTASGFSWGGWSVVLANLALRYGQALYIEYVHVKGPGVLRYLWLLPFKDLLGFLVWFLSFTGNVVRWKDASFRIDRDGRMVRL